MSFFARQDDVINNQKEQLKNWRDQSDKFCKIIACFIYTATLQYIAIKTGYKVVWVYYALATLMLLRIWIRIFPIFMDYIIHDILNLLYPNIYRNSCIYDTIIIISIVFSIIFFYHFDFYTFPALIKSISEVRFKS